jgi:hypothetical protein
VAGRGGAWQEEEGRAERYRQGGGLSVWRFSARSGTGMTDHRHTRSIRTNKHGASHLLGAEPLDAVLKVVVLLRGALSEREEETVGQPQTGSQTTGTRTQRPHSPCSFP